MRKRQKSLSYGQRCTPVSLDAYSLDSVSVCNSSSVRRKGASKRSYGNPAFTDPVSRTSQIPPFRPLAPGPWPLALDPWPLTLGNWALGP